MYWLTPIKYRLLALKLITQCSNVSIVMLVSQLELIEKIVRELLKMAEATGTV